MKEVWHELDPLGGGFACDGWLCHLPEESKVNLGKKPLDRKNGCSVLLPDLFKTAAASATLAALTYRFIIYRIRACLHGDLRDRKAPNQVAIFVWGHAQTALVARQHTLVEISADLPLDLGADEVSSVTLGYLPRVPCWHRLLPLASCMRSC